MKFLTGCLTAIGGLVVLVIAIGIFVAGNTPTDPVERKAAQKAIEKKMEQKGEEFLDQAQRRAAERSAEQLKIGPSSIRSDSFASYVGFPVTNRTDKLLTYADFHVVFYDKDGKELGKGLANTTNLPAGETRMLEALAMEIDLQRVARHEVSFGNSMFK